MDLTLYGSGKTRAMRAMWMLEELGLDYTHAPSPPHAEDVTSIWPSGKVPVMVADGAVIPDSVAILSFLADRTGKLTAPAGSVERGWQDAVMQMVMDDLDGVLWTAAKHRFILPEERRVAGIKPTLQWEFSRNAERIMDLAKGDYLMGDFTYVDILAAHCGIWATQGAKFEVPGRFSAYMERCLSREAFRRAATRD